MAMAEPRAEPPPWLHAQIDYLRTHAPLPLQVDNLRPGVRNGYIMDRFSLSVPCCLTYVKWEVVYNGHDARVAPDFIFGSEDESFQPLMDTSDLSPCNYLREWTVADPARLLKLVLLIRALYLQYQRRKVEAVNDNRVRFEMSTIAGIQLSVNLVNYNSAHLPGLLLRTISVRAWRCALLVHLIESQLIKNFSAPLLVITGGLIGGHVQGQSEEVNFAVPLVLEVESGPSAVPRQSSSTLWNDIALQVKFPVQKGQLVGSAPQLKLVAPPGMREVFDVDDVKLPVWPEHMCLVEYIPTLQQTLQQQVREARVSIGLRRAFMEALFPFFGRPLEADATYCRRISLLTSYGVFTFLVHFALPIQFPKMQPTLTFQSSQHFDARGKPLLSRPYQEYPWSPRWDASQMAQRTFDFVADECLAFKKYCNDVLSHSHQR